jgi:RNA polymerase sigma-70 factor (ECF subfamily)
MYARIEFAEDQDRIGDAELLRYFRRGDQSALDLLMERHRDALFRFCYHLTGNREDAEDVCQETLARAMTRVTSLQSDSAFRSWLFSIARNLSIDTHRRKKRTVAMPDDEAMPIQLFTETPQDRVEVAEEHQTVATAMGKLAQSHQRVLVLREVEGMSYAAIAEELDVSQSAVETLLFRARRRLKEEYHKSAAPALAFLAGIREIILRAGGPAVGGAVAKMALTAAVVGGVVMTLPHSRLTFPQVPLHTGTASHTAAAHSSPSVRHTVTGSNAGSVTSALSALSNTGTTRSQIAVRVPVSPALNTAPVARHTSSPAAHSSSHMTKAQKPAPPAPPRVVQPSHPAPSIPAPPPSNSTAPVTASAPPAPTAEPFVKRVPAAVQQASTPQPTAQPTAVPPTPVPAAPTAVPQAASVTVSSHGKSGHHGKPTWAAAPAAVPAAPAPTDTSQKQYGYEKHSGTTTSYSTVGTVPTVQSQTVPPTGATTAPTAPVPAANVPPGQAGKTHGNGHHK